MQCLKMASNPNFMRFLYMHISKVNMPDRAPITFGYCMVFCMVDVTLLSNLIPDRASLDHFSSTLTTRKKCITVFDESPPNFRSLKINKLSNF